MLNIPTCLAALVLLSGPLVANAQQTTLDYQGSTMSGTAAISTNDCCQNTQSGPATGTLDASIVLNGSLSANDLTVTSLNITVNGQSGLPGFTSGVLAENPGSPFVYQQNSNTSWTLEAALGVFNAPPDGLQLTTANGAITGATISYESVEYHQPSYDVNIGGGSDSYNYGSAYGCAFQLNSCFFQMDVSSSRPGHWTVTTTTAPEIDPASAAGGLTLLLGSLLVLRGRRAVKLGTAAIERSRPSIAQNS